MNVFEGIRYAALRSAYFARVGRESDPEYNLRRIFAWYSHYYVTPLHEVEELPVVDVVRAYWEQQYESMDDEALEFAVKEAAITPEQELLLERARDIDEVDGMRTRQQNQREAERAEAKKKLKPLPPGVKERLPGLPGLAPLRRRDKDVELVPVSKLPNKLPPDIKMTFVGEDEIDLDQDGFGILAAPKPKKKG